MDTTANRTARLLGASALAAALVLTNAPTSAADQVRDGQWENATFALDKVWSVSRGDGVVVAVIDSGVDATHPDLAGSVLPGYDPGGKGLNTRPTDDHGTSMAGIIAAHGHGSGAGVVGVAPGAKILPVYKGKPDGTSAVPEGIRWAVDHGAKVINLSLGADERPGSRPALTEAVAYAAQHDVLIVGAAGNESREAVDSPGNEPGVLAVSAVDRTGALWGQSNSGPEVKIAAPGVDIVIACEGGKYCAGDGTSEATAFVSGTAALLRSKYPQLTARQVANRLVRSAKAPAALKGTKLPDPHYGYGIISPYDALTKDIPAGPPQGPLGAASSSAPASAAAPATGSDPTAALPELPKASPARSSSGVGFGVVAATAGGVLLLLIVVIVAVVSASRGRVRPSPLPYGPPQPYAPPPGHPQSYGQPPMPPPGYPQQQTPNQQPYQGSRWQ